MFPSTVLAAALLSQIDWKASLDDAKGDRPVLWYVHTVRGTKMDRKDVVDDYMKYGPWMMPDVVELVSRRFTAVRTPARGEHDIKPLDFIEPGLVFLAPDGKLIHKIDRISTFQEDWLVDLLRGVLAKWGKPEPSWDTQLRAAKTPVERARILRKMRRPEEALKEADDFERGVILLRQAKWQDAVDAFAKVDTPDAHYLRGAALFNLNRDGREAWDKSGSEKAKAELAGRGPFFRCFEELAWVEPPGGLPTSTTRPSKELDARRCVALLLRTQRASGVWNDSNYDFGGKPSLPNVYMAGTALACAALLAWRDVDPKGVDAAIERALPYLADEKNVAIEPQEIIWAHAYRLFFYARKPDVKKMNEIVGAIEKLQKKSGVWQHEYNAPFTTATVLHCLWEAKQAGAAVPEAMTKKGAEALASCRSDKGVFSYGYPGKGDRAQGGAGRGPLCELALLLNGASKEADVRAAVEAGFEHHALLERVRKYDDHADAFRNGGFFFWYDMLGRVEAIRRLKDGRAKLLERQREIALSITEIDGCFVDSHELGKTYGTAMGLLVMKLTRD